jgi:hypothetical protein
MSKEIENILDECLERILVNGETVEQCLQSYPEHAVELKPLLETVMTANVVSSIQPGPEFRNRARYQLQTAFRNMELKKSRHFFSWEWQPRWVTATVTIALVLLLSSGGTVAAAAGSMPDDTLYPVKLATEQARLVFAFSELSKAELYAELADIRVNEIVYLAENNKPEEIEQTANRLNGHLNSIAALSLTEKDKTGEDEGELLTAMAPTQGETYTSESEEALEGTEETATVAEEIATGNVTASFMDTGKVVLPREAAVSNVETDRQTNLQVNLANKVTENSARLNAVLETAPEAAKPALLKVIAKLESNYQKAIDSLDEK